MLKKKKVKQIYKTLILTQFKQFSNIFQNDQYLEEGGDDGEEENESRPAIGEQTSQRRSRKQSNPEKRKDRVTKEIIKYQSTTKLLIPRLPFQRYVNTNIKIVGPCVI